MPRPALVLALGAVSLAVLAACSSAPVPTAPAAAPTAAGAARNTAAACSALPAMDAVVLAYPGANPSAPPPEAAALKGWAAALATPLAGVAANVPGELDAAVSSLETALAAAEQGRPLDLEDPVLAAAGPTLDKWGHDNCTFTKLDVTGTGTALTGAPATVPAGPLSLSFTNTAPPDRAGFVLLVARVKDGADYTLAAIQDGSTNISQVADVVMMAQPTPEAPTGYFTADLRPGRYVLASPLGTPPNFTGLLATELQVR